MPKRAKPELGFSGRRPFGPSPDAETGEDEAQQGLLSPLILPSPFPWLWFR